MGCNAIPARKVLHVTAAFGLPGVVTAANIALNDTVGSALNRSSDSGEGQAVASTTNPQHDGGSSSEDWDPFGASTDFWHTIFPAMLAAGGICLLLCLGCCCVMECYFRAKRREAKRKAREAIMMQPEVVRVRPARENRRQRPHNAWDESVANQTAKALPVGNHRNTQGMDTMSSVMPTPAIVSIAAARHPPAGISVSMDGPNRISLSFHPQGSEAPSANA
eukprot:CAMPEP_0172712202 /NCGR_PEP_ID=MMETSP1074-20121228/60963_1 /TAXON_ID=2916 /ORGANISM="Ceratium fusus, Strain PA161109" /LENGTH=220 /DNA_ID=CAMNT_0013536097 /DNA_START=44 /DNA_END=703 /DNA_ORIENTATION=-